jgi:hypothetical protein
MFQKTMQAQTAKKTTEKSNDIKMWKLNDLSWLSIPLIGDFLCLFYWQL